MEIWLKKCIIWFFYNVILLERNNEWNVKFIQNNSLGIWLLYPSDFFIVRNVVVPIRPVTTANRHIVFFNKKKIQKNQPLVLVETVEAKISATKEKRSKTNSAKHNHIVVFIHNLISKQPWGSCIWHIAFQLQTKLGRRSFFPSLSMSMLISI